MFWNKSDPLEERPSALARLRDAEDRLDTLARQFKQLDGEFSDLMDRVNRQVARLVKREERATSPQDATSPPGPSSHTPPITMAQARARRAGQIP